jgi:hypothetical protein
MLQVIPSPSMSEALSARLPAASSLRHRQRSRIALGDDRGRVLDIVPNRMLPPSFPAVGAGHEDSYVLALVYRVGCIGRSGFAADIIRRPAVGPRILPLIRIAERADLVVNVAPAAFIGFQQARRCGRSP